MCHGSHGHDWVLWVQSSVMASYRTLLGGQKNRFSLAFSEDQLKSRQKVHELKGEGESRRLQEEETFLVDDVI
jgi:hypothetical protein